MKSNRLLSQQFASGNTADGTRIEQALLALVALFNDVPPNLVQRRWSPSHMVWGLSPSITGSGFTYQWMGQNNANPGPWASTLQPPTAFRNPQRVKSTRVQPLIVTSTYPDPGGGSNTVVDDVFTMEVSFATTSPLVIGSATVLAEVQTGGTAEYTNDWEYGADPPPAKGVGDPLDDFTFQVCISDGWDLENRKKLRQESLVYNMRSDAFKFSPAGLGTATDPLTFTHPVGLFDGFAITPMPLILVPGGARVLFQWSIPKYDPVTGATWSTYPAKGNVWNLSAQCWRPTV